MVIVSITRTILNINVTTKKADMKNGPNPFKNKVLKEVNIWWNLSLNHSIQNIRMIFDTVIVCKASIDFDQIIHEKYKILD